MSTWIRIPAVLDLGLDNMSKITSHQFLVTVSNNGVGQYYVCTDYILRKVYCKAVYHQFNNKSAGYVFCVYVFITSSLK